MLNSIININAKKDKTLIILNQKDKTIDNLITENFELSIELQDLRKKRKIDKTLIMTMKKLIGILEKENQEYEKYIDKSLIIKLKTEKPTNDILEELESTSEEQEEDEESTSEEEITDISEIFMD